MATRDDRRRKALTVGFAVLAATSLGSPSNLTRVIADDVPLAPATGAPLSLVAPAVATSPSVSMNGQFVVFVSAPESGVTDARSSSVWLSDRLTGDLTELTLPRDGTRLGNSINPVISADGCTVVITTQTAYDLFRDDDDGDRWDVYGAKLPSCGGIAGDWALVSTLINDDGQAQARNDVDPTETAAVSSAGSVAAYVRPYESLSGNESEDRPATAIDVVDLSIPVDSASRTVPVPGLPTEAAENSVDYVGQVSPQMSADGSTVVFVSDATAQKAVADWVQPIGAATTVPTQVYAWDRTDADPFTAVTLVSGNGAIGGNASSSQPTVSANGTVIAFSSVATDLVAADAFARCGSSCPAQVYVVDSDSDDNGIVDETDVRGISLISQVPAEQGTPVEIANGASFAPSISGDGITLAFSSKANNLLQIQTPGGGEVADGDLLIADLAGGTALRRAFDILTPTPAANGHPHLSANGRVLVADSLVAGQIVGNTEISGRHIVAATYRPKISLASLDLGTGIVGTPGSEWKLNIVNLGPGAFTPNEVMIDRPDFAISGGSCQDRAPVRPGSSCSVTVILTPSIDGPLSANLTISETGFDAVVLTSPIKGAGGEPALTADPSAADFGREVVGTLSPFTAEFAVTSVSFLPTWVASATMSGANPDDFIVTASTCGAELPLGTSCPVEISFRPTGSGRRTATLSFNTLSGQYTSVLLAGEGFYSATLVSNATLVAGDNLGVGGTGFPADTGVVLSWSDGSGRTALVVTGDDGSFLTNLSTSRNQQAGTATLVAQATDGTSATFTVEIAQQSRRSPRGR
ncbi:MAG: choice-of-anchor D domain-containing protein [Ilumatobacteraceae bacterium]